LALSLPEKTGGLDRLERSDVDLRHPRPPAAREAVPDNFAGVAVLKNMDGVSMKRLQPGGEAASQRSYDYRSALPEKVGTGTANNHSLEYWNAGSILSPSFVPPGSTILLSANLRLS
jgi:hypothetical protein